MPYPYYLSIHKVYYTYADTHILYLFESITNKKCTYFVVKLGHPLKVKNVGNLRYHWKVEGSHWKMKWNFENFNKEEDNPERKQSKDGFSEEAKVKGKLCYVKE